MIRLQKDGCAPRWPIGTGVHLPSVVPTMLIVPRQEIQRALTMHTRHAVMRGPREHTYILYSGDMPGRSGMFVEASLQRRIPSASWNIIVQLRGSSVRAHLRVSLRCGADVLSAVTNEANEAAFEDIPNTWTLDDNLADLHVGVAES